MNQTTTVKLKKVQIFLSGSEETTCFTADIYVNDKKAGYAKNDGRGGCTFYSAYQGQNSLIQQAEAYCASLPDIILKFDDHTSNLKMNLEHFIDEIIDQEAAKKENEASVKRLNKAMKKYLLFVNTPPDQPIKEYLSAGWEKTTIEEMAKTSSGIRILQNTIKKEFAKGRRCINTNLPEAVTGDLKSELIGNN